MSITTSDGIYYRCTGPHRSISFEQGKSNTAAFIEYSFNDTDALRRYREKLSTRGVPFIPAVTLGPGREPGFVVRDPDGNHVLFSCEPAANAKHELPARLQHVVFATTDMASMFSFYVDQLGFVVSDVVHDERGVQRACFLRTDEEHHSLAVFLANGRRLDHHSYLTRDWEHIRLWADHMGEKRVPICWGPGRHGLGGDLFFMVKDPDGNLAEISAENEICAPERPAGTWPHEARTLNVWGSAIMRS